MDPELVLMPCGCSFKVGVLVPKLICAFCVGDIWLAMSHQSGLTGHLAACMLRFDNIQECICCKCANKCVTVTIKPFGPSLLSGNNFTAPWLFTFAEQGGHEFFVHRRAFSITFENSWLIRWWGLNPGLIKGIVILLGHKFFSKMSP